MSSEPLIEAIPLWRRPQDGAIITGWDYPSCEAIGLLKMDFLGLRNLTIIGDCIENIKANRGIDLDLSPYRWMIPRPTNCSAAATPWGVPTRRRPDAGSTAAHAVQSSTTSSPCSRCTVPARWA